MRCTLSLSTSLSPSVLHSVTLLHPCIDKRKSMCQINLALCCALLWNAEHHILKATKLNWNNDEKNGKLIIARPSFFGLSIHRCEITYFHWKFNRLHALKCSIKWNFFKRANFRRIPWASNWVALHAEYLTLINISEITVPSEGWTEN